MQAKPWQIAVVVIGLLVGIGGIVLAMGKDSGPDLADKMILVDVTTGNTYKISYKNRSVVLPVRSPETDERTLFPIEYNEEKGGWFMNRRYMGDMDGIEKISDKVDAESGRVDLEKNIDPVAIKL